MDTGSDSAFVAEKGEASTCESLSFEEIHVHQTYDAIASHFSASRYKEWPKVAAFLLQQPPYALVADAGCGNGKYFDCAQFIAVVPLPNDSSHGSGEVGGEPPENRVSGRERRNAKRLRTPSGTVVYEKEWMRHVTPTRRYVVGFDRCEALLRLSFTDMENTSCVGNSSSASSSKQTNRVPSRADALCCDLQRSPFRSGVFDAILCIAVLHHYSSHSRRVAAVQSLIRLLRPGTGELLIYVWAFEKSKKATHNVDEATGDAMIPWRMNTKFDVGGKVYQRYYHLFKEGELEALCHEAVDASGMKGRVRASYFDKENWCVVLQRL